MRRNTLTLILLVLISCSIAHAGTVYFPQIADGNGYVTTLTFFNPDSTPATGVLKFFNQDGTARIVSLNGTASSQFTIPLQGFGSSRYSTAGTSPSTVSGWASFESSVAIEAVATFDLRENGRLVTTAGVFATSAARRVIIPIAVTPDANSGFAIANITSNTPVTIRLQLIAESGVSFLTVAVPQLTPLPPFRQIADFVTTFFPSVSAGFKGTLIAEIVGPGEMAATSLAIKEGLLSAVPVGTISGPESVVLLGNPTPALDLVAQRIEDEGLPARVNATPLKGAIVLFAVSAIDGPMPQTRVALSREAGQEVSNAAILVTDYGPLTDPELFALVVLEMRELLALYLGQAAADGLQILRSEDPNLPRQVRNLRLSPPLSVKIKNPL